MNAPAGWKPIEEVLPDIIDTIMKAEIEVDGWDLPPALYFVTDPLPNDPLRYRVSELDISNLWAVPVNPVEVLTVIGKAIGMAEAPEPPIDFEPGETVAAVILRNEGWALGEKSSGMSEEELKAWMESGKRLVDHPAAVETKTIAGYSPGSGCIAVWQERNGEARPMNDFEGRIADVLKLIYDSSQKRWPRD